MEIWVTDQSPIKLLVGLIVAMPGEGTMMITQLHHSIDELFSPDITEKHESLANFSFAAKLAEMGVHKTELLGLKPTLSELQDGLD